VRNRLSAVPGDRLKLGLVLALTFGTGIAGAVGYPGLDSAFAATMIS
jgi:uncharacterized membrane protein YoaK (UPF0700 family)